MPSISPSSCIVGGNPRLLMNERMALSVRRCGFTVGRAEGASLPRFGRALGFVKWLDLCRVR